MQGSGQAQQQPTGSPSGELLPLKQGPLQRDSMSSQIGDASMIHIPSSEHLQSCDSDDDSAEGAARPSECPKSKGIPPCRIIQIQACRRAASRATVVFVPSCLHNYPNKYVLGIAAAACFSFSHLIISIVSSSG